MQSSKRMPGPCLHFAVCKGRCSPLFTTGCSVLLALVLSDHASSASRTNVSCRQGTLWRPLQLPLCGTTVQASLPRCRTHKTYSRREPCRSGQGASSVWPALGCLPRCRWQTSAACRFPPRLVLGFWMPPLRLLRTTLSRWDQW